MHLWLEKFNPSRTIYAPRMGGSCTPALLPL
jgi:hypothetical protein